MTLAIVTPEFRLSFPKLFVPSADDNGVLRFRMEMLFSKAFIRANPTCLAEMKQLYNSTLPASWATDNGAPVRKFEAAFIDGDQKKQDERKGHFIIRANSGPQHPPTLKNRDGSPASEAQMYSGCYCRAVLSAFSWQAKNKQGIIINRGASFNIKTVQKTRRPEDDGASFSQGITDAEADALLAAMPLDDEDELAALLG